MPSAQLVESPSRTEQVACNLCGASRAAAVLRKSEWGTVYTIVRCDGCGLVYVNPRGFAIEPDAYFEGLYLDTIERHGRLDTGVELLYREMMQRLQAWLNPGRLLDVGCAMGHFMNYARRHGWEVCGVESSRWAAQWGREHFGLRIHPVWVLADARFPGAYADAAVMIEVIEHLPDPRATLAEIFRILKPGGAVCVTTPNFECYRSLLMREEWAPIIPSGHLYYFTAQTLGNMMRAAGFVEVIELTKDGAFEQDLAFAQAEGKLRLNEAELADLRERLAREDAARLTNARGEGLIFCGRKPVAGSEPLRASLRHPEPPGDLEGKLIQPRVGDANRMFYVSGGVKHWVTSPEWIARKGLRMSEDLCFVDRVDFLPEGPELR